MVQGAQYGLEHSGIVSSSAASRTLKLFCVLKKSTEHTEPLFIALLDNP